MRKLTLAVSLAALGFAGAAGAQQASQQAPMPGKMPQGDMTRAEAQAKAAAAFDRMDANRDGTLDQADREARRAQMFDRMDTDRNGSISREEMAAMHARRADRAHAMHGEAGDHAGKSAMGGMKMMAAKGPVTKQAFVDRMLARFDRADTNRDGIVTPAERKAMHETMRGQMKAKAAQRQPD